MSWDSWAYIFVLFLLLTPAAQLALAWSRKEQARQSLQRERGARVIPIVLELQTVATLGIPLARFEQLPLPTEVVRVVEATPQSRPIDLVVDLPAGVVFDVAPIAAALAAHEAPVTLIVPRRALVGGLALARAADTILLGPGAVLCGDEAAANDSPPSPDADSAPAAGQASVAPAAAGCDLAGLLALGLPAGEGPPAALPAYLARFREPRPTRHRWPLYMALPSTGQRT